MNLHASENPDRIPAHSPWVATKEPPWVSFPPNLFNRNAVAAVHRLIMNNIGRNAVGVVFVFNRLPKLGAGAPTLGFKAQSGWDCFFPAFPFQVFRRFLAYSSCFAVIDPALTLICVF